MNESDISRILRQQAWERAKGELQAMLWTFHGTTNANDGQFEELEHRMSAFIESVESDALQE